MRLRHVSIVFVLAVSVAACSGTTASMPVSPTVTASPASNPTSASAITGTWVGTAAESSGTTLGSLRGFDGHGHGR